MPDRPPSSRFRKIAGSITAAPLHPFFAALFPVAFLYQRNVDQVPWDDALRVGLAVLAGTALCFLVLLAVFRSMHRAALATSGLTLLVLSYGHIRGAIGPDRGDPARFDVFLLPIFGVLAALVVFFALRAKRSAPDAAKILNFVLVVLLLVSAVPAAASTRSIHSGAIPVGGRVDVRLGRDGHRPSGLRDIVYICPDDYIGAAGKKLFGLDNTAFVKALERRGFYVPSDARANYPDSFLSLTSTFHMDYLPKKIPSARAVDPLIRESNLVKFLRSKGYRWVYFRSPHDPTGMRLYDDVTYQYSAGSEFSREFIETTAVGAIAKRVGFLRELDPRVRFHETALFEFRNLPRARRLGGPLFVFAHILMPHTPFTFGADGHFVSAAEEQRHTFAENYRNQVQYLNTRLLEYIDSVLAEPPDKRPIIVIQTEEGVRNPPRKGRTWPNSTPTEIDRHFSIFSAFYTPGVDGKKVLYPQVSPVNSMRAILNLYFDAALPLLPDRLYGFVRPEGSSRALDFVDITSHVAKR